jgi:hypothetical protein
MHTEKLKKLINCGKYPIIHPENDIERCILCCLSDKGFLAQCRHYIILTNYYSIGFYCKIITNSNKYNNVIPNKADYKLRFFVFLNIK